MYDELIKSLHELCEMTALCDDHSCFECPCEEKCSSYKNGRLSAVYRQSADAIEEIQGKYFLMKKTAEWLAEKVPRWIPVTERLPEKTGKYLVCGQWKGMTAETWVWVCELIEFGNIKGWANEARNPAVTHWMPLPELPKEET